MKNKTLVILKKELEEKEAEFLMAELELLSEDPNGELKEIEKLRSRDSKKELKHMQERKVQQFESFFRDMTYVTKTITSESVFALERETGIIKNSFLLQWVVVIAKYCDYQKRDDLVKKHRSDNITLFKNSCISFEDFLINKLVIEFVDGFSFKGEESLMTYTQSDVELFESYLKMSFVEFSNGKV